MLRNIPLRELLTQPDSDGALGNRSPEAHFDSNPYFIFPAHILRISARLNSRRSSTAQTDWIISPRSSFRSASRTRLKMMYLTAEQIREIIS